MVVADALSRNVEEIEKVLSVNPQDKCYNRMIAKVGEDPEKFPNYRIANGKLYRHCQST